MPIVFSTSTNRNISCNRYWAPAHIRKYNSGTLPAVMANSLFSKGKINRKQLHTPTSYRAKISRRHLVFSSPSTSSEAPAVSSASTSSESAQDVAASLLNLSTPAAGSENAHNDNSNNSAPSTDSPRQNEPDNGSNSSTPPPINIPPPPPRDSQKTLPWEFHGNKFTSLYKSAPPKLTYPGGSRNEAKNKRFIKRMDMFLNKNFLVRSAINGDTPHPFSQYARLSQYWDQLGKPGWKFNSAETFSTLDPIKDNGHLPFHAELLELLWFGGVARCC